MTLLTRSDFYSIAPCCIFFWLFPFQLIAARASLPPESLQFQSFETYPDKKGGWYSDNVSSYQINASPVAAFRGQKGVCLTGIAEGELLVFRLPLNPENGGARKIRNLLEHRGRFMLRSSCRGVVRYILRTKDGQRLYSPWIAFHSSPLKSLKAINPDPYLTQTWSAHWQEVELPNYKPTSHEFETEDGERIIYKDEVEPEALDFRCLGDEGSFELHIDEFNIDIEHLMDYKRKTYQKMPLINIAGTFPRPSSLFSSPQFLKLDKSKEQTNVSNSSSEWRANVFKETELRWKSSEKLVIQPLLPLHIATDQGVIGLRIGLRSSGTNTWKLKLVFSEEKLRQAQDGKEPHETFATHLPLDFRGLRYFEIPLCFTGLPLRPNYRLHNKQVDGYLKLDTLCLEPILGDNKINDEQELKLSFVELEQWVDRQTWESTMPAFPNPDFPQSPSLNSSFTQAWPYVLKDMESPETFNTTFKNNEQTWVEVFELNEAAAMRGRHGLAIKLAPESNTATRHDLQATFHFKQNQLPPLSPEGEFQFCIRGRATHDSLVSLWLRDDDGQVFASPYESLPEQKSRTRTPNGQLEWTDFTISDTELKSYTVINKDPEAAPKLPYQPYALHIVVPKVRSKVNLHFDDLAVWTPISKPRLWRRDLRTCNPFFHLGQDMELFSRNLFCTSDAWHIRHTYILEPNWDTGLPDESNTGEDLQKAEERYREAEDKLAAVKKLDPKSSKRIEDYFRPHQCSPIEGGEAKILHFNTDPSGLELSLSWNEQRNLKPWEKYGCSGISLESAFWNERQNPDKPAWIPVSEGVEGMVLTIWNSAHLDTYLRILLVDERNRYFVRRIPLDQAGLFSHHLAFSNESFLILSKSGKRIKDQGIPLRLKLLRVEIEHVPLTPKHAGTQYLKLYPVEWLIDRKKMRTVFKMNK